MKFIVDAQLPPVLARWLSTQFSIDCIAVRDIGLRDATDREIFDYARLNAATMITKDSDFVELMYRYGAPPQIIWVTCGNASNAALASVFSTAFPKTLELLGAGETLVEIA